MLAALQDDIARIAMITDRDPGPHEGVMGKWIDKTVWGKLRSGLRRVECQDRPTPWGFLGVQTTHSKRYQGRIASIKFTIQQESQMTP